MGKPCSWPQPSITLNIYINYLIAAENMNGHLNISNCTGYDDNGCLDFIANIIRFRESQYSV